MSRSLPRLFPEAVVVALLIVGSGVGSLVLGQDINTDLCRYHFYNGYAFVHGRFDTDLVPAALGTFLNPTLDSLHYLGIAHLPPRLFGFLLGALQGLNPALVFLLARRLLEGPGSGTLAVLVGVLAATGPTAHSSLGTTMGDTTVSIPLLASLLVVLGGRGDPRRASRHAGLAGSRVPRGRFDGPQAHHGPLPRRPGGPRRPHGSGATGTRGSGVRVPRRHRPRLRGLRGHLVLAAVGALRQPALSVRQPGLPVTLPARRGHSGHPFGGPGSPGPAGDTVGDGPRRDQPSAGDSLPRRALPARPRRRSRVAFPAMAGPEDAAAAWPAQPVGLRPDGLRGLDGRLLLLPLRGDPGVPRPAGSRHPGPGPASESRPAPALRRGRVPVAVLERRLLAASGAGRIGGGASRSPPRPTRPTASFS